MSKRSVLLVVLFYAATALGTWGQPAIPEVRFRVLYKANNAPVQWLFVEIYCERKLGWSERRKTGQEHEKTYSSFGFYATQDGWVTLPAVEAPGTTEYEVTARAPASSSINYPYSYSGGKASWPFNERTLPKFARIPESQRVLYAEYTSDYHWFVPTQQTSYEGIQFVLSAYEIFLREWPNMMSAGPDRAPYGIFSREPLKSEAPYYKRFYFDEVGGLVYFQAKNIEAYKESAKTEASETRRAEIRVKAEELRARLVAILCSDLAKKKKHWDSFEPASKILNDPFIKEAQCEALKEFYSPPKVAESDAHVAR